MFTLFHALQLAGVVGGLALGVSIGGRFGVAGVIIGGIAGLILGWLAGRIPWFLAWAWMRRDLRRASSEDLRRRVGKEYFVAHLLIAELASRGENIEELRPIIEAQLKSSSPDKRQFAENTARLWFPELVEAV